MTYKPMNLIVQWDISLPSLIPMSALDIEDREEEWVDVVGYEGLYKISNMGNVASLCRGFKLMKPQEIAASRATGFYLRVMLTREGEKPKGFKVHRLVAGHFIVNPLGKPNVNHKNGLKHDNRAPNLEWVTQSENCNHAYRTGLATRGTRPRVCLSTDEVRQIRSMLSSGQSINSLSKKFGASPDRIRKIGSLVF